MSKVANRTLEVTGITADDLDVFVPHQANARISELLARNLKLRENVPVADDIEFTGNTAAASIPLAMYELLKSGRAKPGDTALLLGYGAGLSYSGQVVTMPPAPRF
jgi:beta-ketoacyl ACP synthase